MGENYLDMATVIVIFFALGILLSRLGGIGGIVVRIKRIICKLIILLILTTIPQNYLQANGT